MHPHNLSNSIPICSPFAYDVKSKLRIGSYDVKSKLRIGSYDVKSKLRIGSYDVKSSRDINPKK